MSEARVPAGVPTGGQYAATPRPESTVRLDEHFEHHLAHLGIHTVTEPDGRVVALNVNGPYLACPECRGDKAAQAVCAACAGRGKVDRVPHCDRPWDRVVAGLHLGGHENQPAGGDARVTDQFDVVISLYTRDGYGPDDHVEHHAHTMIDGPLDPSDHDRIHALADLTADALGHGRTVLVRCQAGMNRSGLVAALALMKRGWTLDQALDRMRAVRGPYVLFNEDFTAWLTTQEGPARAGRSRCPLCEGEGLLGQMPCEACTGRGHIGADPYA